MKFLDGYLLIYNLIVISLKVHGSVKSIELANYLYCHWK